MDAVDLVVCQMLVLSDLAVIDSDIPGNTLDSRSDIVSVDRYGRFCDDVAGAVPD